jgi:hypothetical protein
MGKGFTTCMLHQHYLGDKSRRMRWTGHVAHMRRRELYTAFWLENLKGRDRLENLAIDGRIILERILKK